MAGKKIAIMVDEMYQVLEVWYPYYRFREAGLEVNFVAAEAKKEYHSKEGYPCVSEIAAAQASSRDYDCLLVPGGFAPDSFRFSLSFALSFFGPSLETPFLSCVPQTLLWPLLTPRRLSTSGSPRVRGCSFRSCLWALQKAVCDCRASRVLACSPPDSCLTAHLCSFGRTFASRPFAPAPCGTDLAVRLQLASLPPSGTFHPDRPDPCRAHERRP